MIERLLRIMGVAVGLGALIACAGQGPVPRPASTSVVPANGTPSLGASPEVVVNTPPADEAPGGTISMYREMWTYAGFDGERTTTDHFRLHTTANSALLRERLPNFYEALLAECQIVFGPLPPPRKPMHTYIFQDRRQWMAKTRELLGADASAYRTLGRGGFTKNGTAVLYYLDAENSRSSKDTFALAAHEGWHQYTQATFKHFLPVWLEEGLATYMEAFRLDASGTRRFQPQRNGERWEALRDAVRANRLIPMHRLLTQTPQEFLRNGKNGLLIYYAQVWALARFIQEGQNGAYREGLTELLRDAAEGRLVGKLFTSPLVKARMEGRIKSSRSGPAVILVYFNPDLDAFEREYFEFIAAMTAPMGAPSSSSQ